MVSRAAVKVVRLPQWPIARMLAVEEALLRHDAKNWCLVNALAPKARPTVVMGIGGKPELLCDMAKVDRDSIDVLRRFTGGGTVVVGPGTVFCSLIFNFDDVDCDAFPRSIMDWTARLYGPAFEAMRCPGFALRENDYVLGDRKIAGNAQRVSRKRWVHHTSFLWDYDARHMEYLTLPSKRPDYRADRRHDDFITRLRHRVDLGDPPRRRGDYDDDASSSSSAASSAGRTSADFADRLTTELRGSLANLALDVHLDEPRTPTALVDTLPEPFVPSTKLVFGKKANAFANDLLEI